MRKALSRRNKNFRVSLDDLDNFEMESCTAVEYAYRFLALRHIGRQLNTYGFTKPTFMSSIPDSLYRPEGSIFGGL